MSTLEADRPEEPIVVPEPEDLDGPSGPGIPERSDVTGFLDRCDSCGSQAYVLLTFPVGELAFCGHHFAKYEAKLRNISGVEIIDERYKLEPVRPDVSPD